MIDEEGEFFDDDQIQLLLRIGVIEKCNANEAGPIVLVRKKNGEWRMCIDLRETIAKRRLTGGRFPK